MTSMPRMVSGSSRLPWPCGDPMNAALLPNGHLIVYRRNGVMVLAPDGKGLFVGTFHGVFRSTDGGATFTPFGGKMVNSDVRAIAIDRLVSFE